ncbi:MAG: hypothetical protein KF884_04305 [Fimbriimonadaceae bacterium]|nr:hypothetical protein [Fimbriimonadaceae bacterium]QYK59312.1 MAG: hypothetical protein KF884_04305 [Fimbriimonadaceae bacterium]
MRRDLLSAVALGLCLSSLGQEGFLTFRTDTAKWLVYSPDGASFVTLAADNPGAFVSDTAWHRGQMYGVYVVSSNRFIGKVDPATGTISDSSPVTFQGSSVVAESLVSDGESLYVAWGSVAGTSTNWGQIDPSNGVIAQTGNTAYDNDGAGFVAGEFFAVDANAVTDGSLFFKGYPVPSSFVGQIGLPYRGLADFGAFDDKLYGLDFVNNVLRLSPTDGSVLQVIPLAAVPGPLRSFEVLPGPKQRVAPQSLVVRLGRIQAGGLPELLVDDGQELVVCRFFVPNTQVAPVTVEIDGQTSYTKINRLTFAASGKMVNGGVFSQTLDLYDYQANSFSTVDVRIDPVTTTKTRRELDSTGDANRYRGPNGVLKGRYRVRQTGVGAVAVWCHGQDLVEFIVR